MADNSAEHAPSGTKCYSAVLRRLLCSGSLPTHPSDPRADNSFEISLPADENPKPQGGGSNPGVVARLMGLDSFPNSPSTQHDRTLGSFFRSRSTNSIDFTTHFDPVKQHRRVRTSVSFREGMYYHECMGKVEEAAGGEKRNNKENRGGSGNSGKLRDKNAIKKREGYLNERRPVAKKKKNKNKKKAVKAKEETMTPTTTKVLKKRQSKSFGCKVHPQGIAAPAAAGPAKVEGGGVSPGRASPSKIGRPCSNHAEARTVKRGKKGKRSMKRDNYKESCYYKRMVEVICGLTDESVISQKWIYEFEDFDEICNQFGQEILQVLLKQFVDELINETVRICNRNLVI